MLKKITSSLRWTLGTYYSAQSLTKIYETCELIKQGFYIVMFHSLFIIQYAYITFVAKKEYKVSHCIVVDYA